MKALVLVLLLIFFIQPVQAQSVYATNYTAEKDETFKIFLAVNASDAAGIDVRLTFDSRVIQCEDVKLNESYRCGSCFGPFVNSSENFVRIIFMDLDGIKSGNLFDLTFKAVGNSGSYTEIAIAAEISPKISEGKPPTPYTPETVNGWVRIRGEGVVTTTTTTTTATTTTTTTAITTAIPTTTVTAIATTPPATTATLVTTENESKAAIETSPTQSLTFAQTPTPQPTLTEEITNEQTTTTATTHTQTTTETTRTPGFDLLLCVVAILFTLAALRRT